MNEIMRWGLGILLALALGSYSYTYSSNGALEDRIVRQLDVMERKIDRVLEHQWNESQRGR